MMRMANEFDRITRYPAAAVSVWVMFFFIFSHFAFADVSITVRPHIGGSEFDFGQISPNLQEVNKELEVSISGTTGQYEFRQEPLSALRNGQGDEIPWSNFSVRGLTGSNRFGRLKINAEAVTHSVLYTANQSGSADSFTLIYNLKMSSGTKPDFYRGQLRFSVIPVSSGQSTVSVILNVVATVKAEDGSLKASIDIATASGSKIIYLNPKKEGQTQCALVVKVLGSFKKPFVIKQSLLKNLESAEGNLLNPEAVTVEVSEATVGTGLPLTALTESPVALYKSKPTGEADEHFVITYRLADALMTRAGRYRSRLQYAIEEMGLEIDRKILELEIENEPVFDLIITPQDVGGAIEFQNVKPGEGPQRNEVVLEIKSNLGKKYQVNQNVIAPLTDKEGRAIDAKYFKVRTESMDTKGTLKLPEAQEIKVGDTVLFVSDNAGSPDKFRLAYELSGPDDQVRAGDYSTRISYSLLEI